MPVGSSSTFKSVSTKLRSPKSSGSCRLVDLCGPSFLLQPSVLFVLLAKMTLLIIVSLGPRSLKPFLLSGNRTKWLDDVMQTQKNLNYFVCAHRPWSVSGVWKADFIRLVKRGECARNIGFLMERLSGFAIKYPSL